MNISIKKIANIAITAGVILLKNGSEIYRTEDTITRICNSFGAKVDLFVLPSNIVLTVSENNNSLNTKSVTLSRRIYNKTNNYTIIEKVNSFSRSLDKNPVSYVEAIETLTKITKEKPYPEIVIALSHGILSFLFLLLYSNNLANGIVGFISAIFMYFFIKFTSKISSLSIFTHFFAGITAGIISISIYHFYKGIDIYLIVLASVLTLLPGLAITSGLRDALYSDVFSSISRIFEALVLVTALVIGAFSIFAITGNL